ncbi:MAG: TrbG/VirB9 family P-type conjugative transfer protein, partial [Gammaproteobacteria bacterium]|nr:TrbG/VirB9 family P-type conjugative transfer protein [Gammaproteobacteria bacterium]
MNPVGRNLRKGEAESVSAEAQRLRSSEAPSATPGVAAGMAEPSPTSVDLARSSFDYKIEGEAEFRPSAVFDDGRFTWFKLPKGAQVSPALFALDAKGETEIASYV